MSHDTNTQQELIFALDIGTRSVVGLVVAADGEQYRVVDCAIQEHSERSMLDGQIHDVVAVANVIRQIKDRLSEKHGTLTQVAVAAAGRSLRTRRVSIEVDIRHLPTIQKDDILTMEFSAVQEAQAQLAHELNETDSTRYYCVGYSVVNYYLDNEMIGSLIDQRGDLARVDVIATFLPRVVVDSLLAALKRCDLDMQALTLEPIAAINVLIPSTMRRLNIALVDIGAGTSDIALTEEGAITAYGMVPVAGDEITDALMNAFLLDFPVAEEVKRAINTSETVSFLDILGMEHTLTREEITAAIDNDIANLAHKIAGKILELNGKAPQAVMLIGGGSLTPNLPAKVAEMLEMPAARVAVRGADAIKQFVGENPIITGPEFVTPVGIAVAARRQPIKYITVTVNDNPIRIFDLRKMTLGDALISAGLDIRRLHGRPGLAMSLTVNGRMKIIPGGHGTAPQITKNGEPAALDTTLANDDVIHVIPGENGQNAKATITDVIDTVDTLDLTFNGEPLSLGPVAFVGGVAQPFDTLLQDRSDVEIRLPRTISEVMWQAGLLDDVPSAADKYRFTLNNREYSFPRHELHLTLNGKNATLQDRVKTGDIIEHTQKPLSFPMIKEVIPPEEWVQEEIKVFFNDQPIAVKTGQVSITMDGQTAGEDQIIHDDAVILVKSAQGPAPVFSDVFRYVDVSLDKPAQEGLTKLVMRLNGEVASFQTPIHTGDKLELFWE
ncbi:cell division protein FtsA [Brevibacillus dissolubilis]|uniref:cell division protein FtsA n=1 Tax=Brevibacillus dissolubilis TaxID=1844116 RepID=UPI00210038FF|nr:cell division FtsA domain-containing protein [Brevibacillus dissolubilis]